MDREAARVWADPDAPALCLVALALDRYGDPDAEPEASAVNWSPHTWAAEIKDDTGIDLSPDAASRLHAGLSLLHSPDEFYRTVSGFHTVIEALVSDGFDPGTTHPLSTAEILWGVFQAGCITGNAVDRPFTPEIEEYVRRVCRSEGYKEPPEVLRDIGIPPAGGEAGHPDTPEHTDLVRESLADFHGALAEWLRDKVLHLADQIERLPLTKSDPTPIAQELRAAAGQPKD